MVLFQCFEIPILYDGYHRKVSHSPQTSSQVYNSSDLPLCNVLKNKISCKYLTTGKTNGDIRHTP